ncbi:hypothetical protein D3C81_1351900 [compost metagenome]
MLTVQRRQVAAVEHDRRDTAGRQGDAAARVTRRIEQVNGPASGDRGAAQQHAALLHFMPGQGDVTRGSLNQPAVADPAATLASLEAGRDFVAKGCRKRVAFCA